MSLEMALTRGVFRLVPRMLDSEELTRRSMALPR
ncbi:MAG: alpha/beta hydrolase, partial [Schaalia georgiae]|nr:alpha/beta hydrolase [Schaalia georgiae]